MMYSTESTGVYRMDKLCTEWIIVYCEVNTTVVYLFLLQRLPLTIPRLVEASPIQSSDGLLYAGM